MGLEERKPVVGDSVSVLVGPHRARCGYVSEITGNRARVYFGDGAPPEDCPWIGLVDLVVIRGGTGRFARQELNEYQSRS